MQDGHLTRGQQLVEQKARALTRFHAIDEDYKWSDLDLPFLPLELQRDVLMLLMVIRCHSPLNQRSGTDLLPPELIRMIIQNLAQLHRAELRNTFWWPLAKHHLG